MTGASYSPLTALLQRIAGPSTRIGAGAHSYPRFAVFFRVLGRVELEDDSGKPITVRPMERRLLAVMLVDAGKIVSVDRVVDALWRDSPPSNPEAALQVHVSRLRKALPDPTVVTSRAPGYQLVLHTDQLDASVFEQLVREGEVAYELGDRRYAAERLGAAEGLWRGPAFAAYDGEEFVRPEASRLQQLRIVASALRFECLLDTGMPEAAIPELEVVVATHPFNERFATQLARALYADGRQREALGVLDRLRATLREELGVDPMPDTESIYEKMLGHDADLVARSAHSVSLEAVAVPVGGIAVDGDRGDFPSDRHRQHAGPPQPGVADRRRALSKVDSLPAQLTRFLGRDRELAEVGELLRKGRVLSILGVGGVGKTRLAAKVAEEVGGSTTGVMFVSLATHTDAGLVSQAVARALGIPEDVHDTPEEALQTFFLDRSGLLVLDNCEHLVVPMATLIRDLVTTCPDLTVITTSRRPLSLPGEITYVLQPLDVDDAAVHLFLDRAELAKPGFTAGADESTIRHICERLDGLPLAIEMAAARVRLLEPEEIARRLDQRFELLTGGAHLDYPHHMTLRATFDWSYHLLTEEEQWALRRLSVLHGGVTHDTAATLLTGASSPLETLLSLADQSWLQPRGRRFHMLETVTAYALERLRGEGEDEEASRAQAHIFAALVEQAEEQVAGESQREALDHMETELDNIRAALAWSLEHEPLLGARMTADLGPFWYTRGYLTEGRTWLTNALSIGVDPALGARLHMTVSKLAWEQYDFEEAYTSSQRARSLAEAAGDRTLLGRALAMVARNLIDRHDYESANQMLGEALGYLDGPTDEKWLADCYRWLGHTARYEGRLDEAVMYHRQAKELFFAAGIIDEGAEAYGAEGRDLFLLGDIEAAVTSARDTIEMFSGLQARVGVASGQVILAQILAFYPEHTADSLEAVSLYRDGLPVLLEAKDVEGVAQLLDGAVPLLVELGHASEAAEIWGAILDCHEKLEVPEIWRGNAPVVEKILEDALGADPETHVEAGRSMSIDEATGRVLGLFEQAADPATFGHHSA
ncbi:MAG TPA: BTAD domain-containing putative transcriptional regulator [Acidimicrobiia bacterium]|nr:BTAD domain-containing putative transcriptional regulator [Acidimicrobiia bacterium]